MQLQQILIPDITLVLADGNKYTFSRLHLNAQAAIMGQYGVSLSGSGDESEDGSLDLGTFLTFSLRKPDVLRFVAWQLLRRYHNDITEEEVGYLITLEKQTEVFKTVTLSIFNSLPIPEDKKKEIADEAEVEIKRVMSEIEKTIGSRHSDSSRKSAGGARTK